MWKLLLMTLGKSNNIFFNALNESGSKNPLCKSRRSLGVKTYKPIVAVNYFFTVFKIISFFFFVFFLLRKF